MESYSLPLIPNRVILILVDSWLTHLESIWSYIDLEEVILIPDGVILIPDGVILIIFDHLWFGVDLGVVLIQHCFQPTCSSLMNSYWLLFTPYQVILILIDSWWIYFSSWFKLIPYWVKLIPVGVYLAPIDIQRLKLLKETWIGHDRFYQETTSLFHCVI